MQKKKKEIEEIISPLINTIKEDIFSLVKGEIIEEIKNLKCQINSLKTELLELKEPLNSSKKENEKMKP